MDISASISNSVVPSIPELGNEKSVQIPSDDQYFLLYLIMGTYFGPDLYKENPRKCVFHRLHEGLHSYTIDELANSHIKTFEIERIYYYVLRKADKSVTVKQEMLHQFFYGNLPTPENEKPIAYPQFPDLFPPHLHPHSRAKSLYKTIENVVFINNPAVYYLRPEIIEKFKRLTGLEDYVLDRDEAMLYTCISDNKNLENVMDEEPKTNGELLLVKEAKFDCVATNALSPSKGSLPNIDNNDCYKSSMTYSSEAPLPCHQAMIFFPNPPNIKDWENIAAATKGSALTGTAVMGQMGPAVGLMDFGECDDSYIFRVSLPGVVRDESEFSCEVESDGKVVIKGVTATGEETVNRYSHEFEMQTQRLCPPGNFSISFNLPGPVDPQHFSGNFGSDAILEGIVVKAMQTI